MRDVVITGLGLVSPLGWKTTDVVKALEDNRDGLILTDLGLGTPLPFGGIDQGFWDDAENLMPPSLNSLPLTVDPGFLYGIYATQQALLTAGFEWRENAFREHRTNIAFTISSSKGFLRCFVEAHREWLKAKSANAALRDIGPLFGHFPADSLASAIARFLGAQGPIMVTSAACATGLISVILGANLIRDGLADIVIAGSAECTRNPMALAGFLNMGALSARPCCPFDRQRSGFNPGEGAAAFVLESAEHARRRGAEPLAFIRAYEYRSEAYHVTAVALDCKVTEHALRRCLTKARWNASNVEYINAHGTGTPLNDAAEAALLEKVFGAQQPLISSLKGHIGHLLGASASVELALTLLSVRSGFVPPTLRLSDPEFPLNYVAFPGLKKNVRRFMKFSLGFGGHIAMMALEIT